MIAHLDKDTEAFVDVGRGVAALAVLITHSLDFGIRGIYGIGLSEAPDFWRWIAASLGHGSFFVWGFFVISGFCIHLSIVRTKQSGGFNWRNYARARVSRIYPLYLLGFLLAIFVWWWTKDPSGADAMSPWPQFLSSLFSLQIFTNSFPNFMQSWSLSIEMIYYGVWPLLLSMTGWSAFRALTVGGSSAILICMFIGFLWNVLHLLETSTAVNGLWSTSILFPLWLGGVWLAENWVRVSNQVTRKLWYLSFPLCLGAELILMWVKYHQRSQAVIDFTGLGALPGLVLLLAGARHARLGSYAWLQPWIRWLGRFSYPCYILHIPLLILLVRLVIPYLPEAVASNPLVRSAALLIPTLLFLAVIGPWLEKRLMTWRSTYLAKLVSKQT